MIVAERLTKHYGSHVALADVSFAISANEVVGLLGLNGVGKTTTLRILSGLLVPSSGTVRVHGQDLAQDPERLRAHIGFSPETPPLYEDMGVAEFLTFVAHIRGVTGAVSGAVDEAMAALDLTGVAGATISTLSHGYRRRVGIAQAIVSRPGVILLDEPTSGLDPVQVVQMRELIRGLRARHAIMLSSHILGEVQKVCDRILVLRQGRIAAQGSPAELSARRDGRTTVGLEVRGSRAALEQALAPTGHRLCAVDWEKDGITRATVELRDDATEDLARVLVQAGLGLRRLEPRQPEVESIFLELTQDRHGEGMRPS